jgi:hypothetical protein
MLKAARMFEAHTMPDGMHKKRPTESVGHGKAGNLLITRKSKN